MITLLYASILGLLLVVLSSRVIYLRRAYRVGIGAAEHRDLERAIRAHGNLIEYAPLALIIMMLLEQYGAPAWQLHALGAALVISRHFHAWGLSRRGGPSWGRMLGMLGTLLVILLAAALGVVRFTAA